MAKDEATGAGDAEGHGPEEDLTLQERINRARALRRAQSAAGGAGEEGAEGQASPAEKADGAAADGAPADGSPDDVPGIDAVDDVLQRRRAELRAKLRKKIVGDSPAAQPSEPSEAAAPGEKEVSPPESPKPEGEKPPSEQADASADDSRPQAAAAASPAAPGRQRLTEVVVLVNAFLLAVVVGVLIYTLSSRSGGPSSVEAAMAAVKAVEQQRSQAKAPRRPQDANGPAQAAEAPAAMPSWAAAEAAFAKKNYTQALDRYRRLLLACRVVPAEAICADFFQYRIGQCVWQMGRAKQARPILEKLTHSDSPVLRAAASAELARADALAGRHLQARVLAYRALAALKAIEESLALEADCDYLIARALTEKAASFHTADPLVPWSRLKMSDAFAGRSEAEIRQLLEAGAEGAGGSQPGPNVRIARTARAWTLSSSKAALEDVLHQFAAKVGKDVQWRGVAPAVRRRGVRFTFREVSEMRACELACGMAGLLGRFAWDKIVVHDPESITTLREQRELLGDEALSAWRRFSLRFSDDERTPEGQFARAALYELAGDTVGAMRQYQLIGRQYRQERELAPKALMRSAKLRMGLRDYAGARVDLQDVLDLYPRYPQTDRVYLSLGLLGMRAAEGEKDPADAGKYLKLATEALLKAHDLNASAESRAKAALEAGDCYYRRGLYPEASKWLSRYITLAAKGSREALVRAYLLLGRSELAQGNRNVAAEAFRRALAARPLRNEYVEAVLALTNVLTEMEDFVEAMATVSRIEKEPLTEEQRYRYGIAVSRLYRSMGLPDRARALLRKVGESISQARLQALIAVERGRCLREGGDLQAARQCMSEALGRLPAGPAAHAVSLELASICMAMDEPEQAIVFAREVLRGKGSEELRRRALETLGRAYLRQRAYEKAVRTLALLGGAAPDEPAGKGEGR